MSTHGEFSRHLLFSQRPMESADFYCQLLDWKIAPKPCGTLDIHDHQGDPMGAILSPPPGEPEFSGWVGCVAVDDTNHCRRTIEGYGGRILEASAEASGHDLLAVDPLGAIFGFNQSEIQQTSHGLGSCHWNELVTSDQPQAWWFYNALFAWRPGHTHEWQQYRFEKLVQGGRAIGTFGPLQRSPKPSWIFYFLASSGQTAATAIHDMGGKVRYGPTKNPKGIYTIVGLDPLGTLFALHCLDP